MAGPAQGPTGPGPGRWRRGGCVSLLAAVCEAYCKTPSGWHSLPPMRPAHCAPPRKIDVKLAPFVRKSDGLAGPESAHFGRACLGLSHLLGQLAVGGLQHLERVGGKAIAIDQVAYRLVDLGLGGVPGGGLAPECRGHAGAQLPECRPECAARPEGLGVRAGIRALAGYRAAAGARRGSRQRPAPAWLAAAQVSDETLASGGGWWGRARILPDGVTGNH